MATRSDEQTLITSGAFWIPEERIGETSSPLLVNAHGSVGLADRCAPSKDDDDTHTIEWKPSIWAYASQGWIIAMPDNPGLGTPGITAWMFSPDEGRSILDATRAARNLFIDGVLSDKNAVYGNSLGAHGAISAHSYAKSYGTAGSLDLVIFANAYWISMASWGAVFSRTAAPIVNDNLINMALMYFYGHLAVHEGEEHAVDHILPEYQDMAQELFETKCWHEIVAETERFDFPGLMRTLGGKNAQDIVTTDYVDIVGLCGLGTCNGDLAQTWYQRWTYDRPPPDTTIPLVYIMAEKDEFIIPKYQYCGVQRLEAQTQTLSLCIDKENEHGKGVSNNIKFIEGYFKHYLIDSSEELPECIGEEGLADYIANDEELTDKMDCTLPLVPNSFEPDQPQKSFSTPGGSFPINRELNNKASSTTIRTTLGPDFSFVITNDSMNDGQP